MTTQAKMPTRSQFDAAASKLAAAGWEYRATMMADDAKKPGVTNFGKLFAREGREFWLNFKTIEQLPI